MSPRRTQHRFLDWSCCFGIVPAYHWNVSFRGYFATLSNPFFAEEAFLGFYVGLALDDGI